MSLRATLGLGVVLVALFAVGHGTVVTDWDDLLPLHRSIRTGRLPVVGGIGGAASLVRRHLLSGRRSELDKIIAASRFRRSEAAVVAVAEASHWDGDGIRRHGFPPGALGDYLAVLAVSSALRSRIPVPVAWWSRIAAQVHPSGGTGAGAAHGTRLASVLAAVNPVIGGRLAREQLRAHMRSGDSTGAARSLLLLGALQMSRGHAARARVLTERAAHRAAASSDGGTSYAALAQLADLSRGGAIPAENLCSLVPIERERLRGSCLSGEALRMWGEGRIRAAVRGVEAARAAGDGFGPWWDMDLASRIAPILIGLGRWDEFDAIAGSGIEAAALSGQAETQAELWLKVALSARAQGYHAMAGRALEKARQLARASRTRIAVEVAAARLAFARGDKGEAARTHLSVLELARNGPPIPFDAYLMAADLSAATPAMRLGKRRDVTAAGLSLLPGLLETLVALEAADSSESAEAAFRTAALRLSNWADAAGRSDLDGALAAARSVWTRLAGAHLANGRPVEALLAVERLRAGLHDTENLKSLRRSLDPGTGILVFADLSNEMWWWALDVDGVVFGRVPGTAAEVRGRSAAYARRLRGRIPGVDVMRAGRDLSEVVLAPVFRERGWGRDLERVVVIAAAGLAQVPIDTLPLPGDPKRTLGERYVVTRATSLLSLRRAMASRPQSSHRVGFVPRVGPDAQKEARVVRETGARVLIGPSATRDNFLRLASGAELVHFGGHAVAANVPGGAAMSFAGSLPTNQALRVSEIAGMQLGGATIVLLGCDTGGGSGGDQISEVRGRSLAEAFARAGGRGVAASLWPIDDESAREIASNLYSGGSALPTAASLARAKAALRRRYPRQPYRWAGFVWYGPPTVGD